MKYKVGYIMPHEPWMDNDFVRLHQPLWLKKVQYQLGQCLSQVPKIHVYTNNNDRTNVKAEAEFVMMDIAEWDALKLKLLNISLRSRTLRHNIREILEQAEKGRLLEPEIKKTNEATATSGTI